MGFLSIQSCYFFLNGTKQRDKGYRVRFEKKPGLHGKTVTISICEAGMTLVPNNISRLQINSLWILFITADFQKTL